MIRIEQVTKFYGKQTVPAVDTIDLTIEKSKIYGLLGRNGAGKTTLLNIITNRVFPTSGTVTIDGATAIENDEAQGKIFCMTEKGNYPPELRVKQGFYWAKQFYRKFDDDYAAALSKKFGLDTNKRLKALSTGYGSIFKLIATLASGAPILIFDEPVLGLDAGMREMFYRELMEYYAKATPTIVISTHLIEEVADIMEEVIFIKDGRIIVNAPVEEVRQGAYIVSGPGDAVRAYSAGRNMLHIETIGNFAAATIDGMLTKDEMRVIAGRGLEYSHAKIQDIFIKMTAKEEN